jgi:hypothetical protein
MRIVIIFAAYLIVFFVTAHGQGVDSSNSRIDKIKGQLPTYMHEEFVEKGVSFIQNSDIDLGQEIEVYDYYISLISNYIKAKATNMVKGRTLEDSLDYYRKENGGYKYVWNYFPEEAEKARELNTKRLNMKDNLKELIDNKVMDFLLGERDSLNSSKTKPYEYESFNNTTKDIIDALKNIKADILEKSKSRNSDSMVKIISRINLMIDDVKRRSRAWNSFVVNKYLDLVAYDLFVFNTYNNAVCDREISVRKIDKSGIPLGAYFTHPVDTIKAKLLGETLVTKRVPAKDYKNNLIESISSFNADMIKATDEVSRKKYLDSFSNVKESLGSNALSDMQEAQKVFDAVCGTNAPVK